MAIRTNQNLMDVPKILVVGSLTPPDATDWLEKKLQELSSNVLITLTRNGAEYIFVEASASNSTAEALIDQVAGLLLLGGGDADPSCYGQVPITDTMYAINLDADRFELDLILQARTVGKPIFGICRGMQLINIAFGGDMIQEIGPGCHNGNLDNSSMVSHPVTIKPGSKLHAVYGTPQLTIRSAHHQAVARVGEGLKVTAQAPDGLVEAIEATSESWIVGVQWHPEENEATKEDFDMLINAFLNAARVYRELDQIHFSEPVISAI
ncbi:gamma-glutamyl-gamma-aminobutyrate hydrolase family protein [Pseudomonas sp. S2_A02]